MQITKFVSEFINDEEKPEQWIDDDEWIERFFQEVQYVRDETLQKLWARLLKEKIYRPSMVNKRVVYIIRDLDYHALQFVSRTMKFFVEDSIPHELVMGIGTMKSDIISLADLGLVLPLEVEKEQTINDVKAGVIVEINLKGYILKLKATSNENNNTRSCFPVFSLTQEGIVLYNIIQDRLDENEAKKYAEFFSKTYNDLFEVTIKKV